MATPDTPGGSAPYLTLPHGDPVAVELTLAIHGGELGALRRILAERPELALAVLLIDHGGADLETPGGSIGTQLDNAIGYACWNVARLLVARGATVDKLWHAAALGMLERVEQLLEERPEAARDVSQSFWHACAGGRRRAAQYLLARGADLDWVPGHAEGTPLDAASSFGTRQDNVVSWLREIGATSNKLRD
jgi:uncharacterized protein